jgi:hypothetical protein
LGHRLFARAAGEETLDLQRRVVRQAGLGQTLSIAFAAVDAVGVAVGGGQKRDAPVAKGGNMQVDTGFLRNSFNVTLNAPDLRVTMNEGGGMGGSIGDYALTIASADLGDTIFGMFTANYAGYVHYGANGRPGRLFVDLAAQRWPSIVAANAAKLSGR